MIWIIEYFDPRWVLRLPHSSPCHSDGITEAVFSNDLPQWATSASSSKPLMSGITLESRNYSRDFKQNKYREPITQMKEEPRRTIEENEATQGLAALGAGGTQGQKIRSRLI